jgi:catechol 2,3-dioxygenase-like lactoylglutathione lyase family enzyme
MNRHPVMFKVLQIDHVELFVPDRYAAARWYEHVLGLRILPDYEEWAVDGGPLMISSDEGSTKLALFEGQPEPSPQTAAFRRVAFRVTAVGFAEFLGRLPELALTDGSRRPVTRSSVVDHQKAYSIYFSDPYGHLLEITTYDYPETSAHLGRSAND